MSRIDNTINKRSDDFNNKYYQYITKDVQPSCQNVATPQCSRILPDNRDPYRPILFHRFSYSSGGPVMDGLGPESDFRKPTPDQRARLDHINSIQSMETRSFKNNLKITEHPILAEYRTIPNREATHFHGFMAFEGMNQSTRLQNLCEVENRFERTKNVGYSSKSYGSYGVE